MLDPRSHNRLNLDDKKVTTWLEAKRRKSMGREAGPAEDVAPTGQSSGLMA